MSKPETVAGVLAEIPSSLEYSQNFASSKPDLDCTAKTHILGLCSLLARIESALAAGAEPVASVSGDFIRRTNEDYAAWCKTTYVADSLDEPDSGHLTDCGHGRNRSAARPPSPPRRSRRRITFRSPGSIRSSSQAAIRKIRILKMMLHRRPRACQMME